MINTKKTKGQIKIAKIIAKSVEGSASKKELEVLEQWIKASPGNNFFYKRFMEEDKLHEKIEDYNNIDIDKAKQKFEKRNKRSILYSGVKKYLKYAAVLSGVILSVYWYQDTNSNSVSIPKDAITLKLEDGSIEVITFDDKRKIKNTDGKIVGEQEGNKLNYKDYSESEKLVYNELSVPHGKTFQLVLSDGTKVHLNAGSSIKYPVKFIKGKDRKISLKGEAFFDVAKDEGHPFVLNSNEINIRVLGTKFNVASYPEDADITTVLVEGSISLYTEKGGYTKDKSLLLEPGYKASWNKKDKKVSVKKVDTNIYTGWTEGKLIFKDLPFKNIRKKLERKYNVSIVNNNKILEENTYTAIFDIETIEQVLQTLNKNFSIKYTIEENQITIN